MSWLNYLILAVDQWGFSTQHRVKHSVYSPLDSFTFFQPKFFYTTRFYGMYYTLQPRSLLSKLCITHNSNKHQSLCTQLNGQKVLFQTIKCSISHLFALSLNVKLFYLTKRSHLFGCYHSRPEWTCRAQESLVGQFIHGLVGCCLWWSSVVDFEFKNKSPLSFFIPY